MIKNIAAAAALALSTALLACGPAQAAAPQKSGAFPLPPFGYVLLAPAPIWHAPLIHPAYHPAYHPAFYGPAVVRYVHS